MIKKPLILLLCTLMLAACDNKPAPKDIEEPVKADTSEMLLGYDLDKDGIREDVEEYIKSLSITDVQKAATRFEAKVLQDTLSVDIKNADALQANNKNMMDAIVCMNAQFENYEDADAIGISLEERTFNTSKRAAAYEAYNKALADLNLVIEIPTGNTCQSV